RIVTLEGSRTNVNIPKDNLQDYDITFFVIDMGEFLKSDDWLSVFGNRIMMQKPEDMELFPPEEKGFSYIMLFDDGVKIDLTLLPVSMLEEYLTRDKLVKIMLDKDNMIKTEIVPTDEDYYIKCPTERKFDDCCNEFWNVATYVSKGLLRGEILFAIDHMNEVLRHELLRMISWYVGTEKGFNFSLGKNYKFLDKHISKELWDNLLNTYSMSSYEEMWKSFDLCLCLFKKISKKVADSLGYNYPDYDENVTKYLETQKRISNKYLYGNRY
ncbi:MAG TPA: aminoglycoside 6-adenylyltransferase, partial [Candidatus Fimenecus excrementavium]|nr:aminoglycoside 6-adenylyltransferase [Candidatus Fimenecus excrementavium]